MHIKAAARKSAPMADALPKQSQDRASSHHCARINGDRDHFCLAPGRRSRTVCDRPLQSEDPETLRITVVCSIRNEGPFIVEWACWYRMLGFTDIVIISNDCTDHSVELLDALAAAHWLHHIRCDVPSGKQITFRKLRKAKEHKSVRRAAWVMVCDVDEFLVIHKGDGLIGDLIDLAAPAPAFLGMSINWRVFGTSGRAAFEDTPVHRQFVYCCPTKHRVSRVVKSIFRQPKRFASLGEHGPRGLDMTGFGAEWGTPGLTWVNPDGQTIPVWTPEGKYRREMPPKLISLKVAQINHYMVRSEETFSLKHKTLSPVAGVNRYTKSYFDRANRGEEPDASAFRYSDRYDAVYAQALTIPDVARLHYLCCADHLRLIAEKHGRDIALDPRYQAFLDLAENPEAARCVENEKSAAGDPAAPLDLHSD